MNSISAEAFEAFVFRLADAARAVTLEGATENRAPHNKGSNVKFDPVTEADFRAEAAIRSLIEAHYPDHAIQGEEFQAKAGSTRYTWSIDPIDGTRAYICGLPCWTTLIALLHDDEPILGLVDAPALDERYLGSRGSASLITNQGSRPISSSRCRTLAEARLSTTDPYLFGGEEAKAFDRLRRSVRVIRYGYDGYAYACLAAGHIDLVIESGLCPYDYRALAPVVRGAGGVIGNWRGGPGLEGGDVLAAATQELFDEAVEILAKR